MYGKGDFAEIEDIMYYRTETGDLYELDFDDNNRGIRAPVDQSDFTEEPPTKKKNIESDGKLNEANKNDMTMEQYEENYWPSTKLTKTDGSYNMMEARTRALMEAKGISREVASKEVKARMKKDGSENTNTDMDKEVEEEEEEEEKKDTVDICPKELATLREKAKQLDTLTEEKEKLEADLDSFKNDFLELKKEYDDKKAADAEIERQDVIERISKDFVIAKEKLEENTLEELKKYEGILDMAIKRNKEDTDEPEITEDLQEQMDFMQSKSDELDERYRHDP
jgi:hypothetical protein